MDILNELMSYEYYRHTDIQTEPLLEVLLDLKIAFLVRIH